MHYVTMCQMSTWTRRAWWLTPADGLFGKLTSPVDVYCTLPNAFSEVTVFLTPLKLDLQLKAHSEVATFTKGWTTWCLLLTLFRFAKLHIAAFVVREIEVMRTDLKIPSTSPMSPLRLFVHMWFAGIGLTSLDNPPATCGTAAHSCLPISTAWPRGRALTSRRKTWTLSG